MIWTRIKSWFTPRDTAQDIIDTVIARGAIRDIGHGIYIPEGTFKINGLTCSANIQGWFRYYDGRVGHFYAPRVVVIPFDPKPETPFVPQLPLL